MINFYLNNVFLITVVVLGLALIIPISSLLILRLRGISLENAPDIKDSLVQVSAGLLMAGFVIPLITALLIKINPNAIQESAPYAGYIIVGLLIFLVFINVKRFKFIEDKKLLQLQANGQQSKTGEELKFLETKIQEHKFQMITLIIFIVYMAILFNLR